MAKRTEPAQELAQKTPTTPVGSALMAASARSGVAAVTSMPGEQTES